MISAHQKIGECGYLFHFPTAFRGKKINKERQKIWNTYKLRISAIVTVLNLFKILTVCAWKELGKICILKGFTVPYMWLWWRSGGLFIQEEMVWGVGGVDWIEFSCWKSLAPSVTPACWRLPIVDSVPIGRRALDYGRSCRRQGPNPSYFKSVTT